MFILGRNGWNYITRKEGKVFDEIWDGKKRTRKLSVSKINTLKMRRLWDLAGLLLIEEAGGKVTRLDGSDNFDFVTGGEEAKNDVLATNGLLHDQALKAFKYYVTT
jgi:hypothetical protein